MTSEPDPTRTPGATFAGRYLIEAALGRGGMGEVARAFDKELRRRVAIKRLVSARDHDGEARKQRLLREARAVAQLNHPNVVSIYDVGEWEGIGFVVMELVEGGALHDRTRSGSSWTLAEAVGWLVDAASGLARAHESGLVHRDIKPPNLLVSREGRLKVADFGIVKELEGRGDATIDSVGAPLTEDGHVVGTPRYMAPEQLRGEEVDGRTDQYAWGIVAYELFGGVHPYDSRPSQAALTEIARGAFVPSPLSLRVPSLPPALAAVVTRAMRAEPSGRFASMNEALHALEEAAKGHDLESLEISRPDARPESSKAFANQPTARATSASSMPPRPPAGTTETMGDILGPSPSDATLDVVGLREPRPAPAPTATKTSSLRRAVMIGGAVVGTTAAALGVASLRGRQPARPSTPASATVSAGAPGAGSVRGAVTPCGADDWVEALAIVGNTLLVGGDFEAVGCPTGAGAVVDPANGDTRPGVVTSPIEGIVTVAIADPARPGGFYVGGEFSRVAGRSIGHVVRLRPDGSVDPEFDAQLDDNVHALAIAGTNLYVAGRFKHAGKAERQGLAALDSTTGGVRESFSVPDARGVDTLAIADGKLYVGGDFDDLGDVKRRNLAALDAATGKVLPWTPRVDGRVKSLVVAGGKLYALGRRRSLGFHTIDGQARTGGVAAFDIRTGRLTPFDPKADVAPDTIAVKGEVVYLTGPFDRIGGAARDGIAALDAKTGRALPFQPKVAGLQIDAIDVTENTLYLGGRFRQLGKITRLRAAAVDLSTGELTAFDPRFSGDVATIAVSGSSVFAGGELAASRADHHPYLVALDRSSGKPTSLDFGVDNTVSALVARPDEKELVVGGSFSTIGGKPYRAIAKLELGTTRVIEWNAKIASGLVSVATVAPDGTVYVAGTFSEVGGEPREGLAALDARTAAPLPFRAKLAGDRSAVHAMVVSGSVLYVGGEFEEINGVKRKGLAAVDARTGAVLPFVADMDEPVEALVVTADAVFAGGKFAKVGTAPRESLVWLGLDGKPRDTRIDSPVNGWCHSLTMVGTTLFGGCGTPQSGIVAFDVATKTHGALTVPLPRGARVRALAVDGPVVYAGGSVRAAGGIPRDNLFAFDRTTGAVY